MFVNLVRGSVDVVRIDPQDTSDLHRRLAHVILPLLLQRRHNYRVNRFGTPGEFNPARNNQHSDQLDFDFIDVDEEYRAGWNIAFERYSAVLDAMIWSFDRIVSDPNLMNPPEEFWPEDDPSDRWVAYWKEVEAGIALFGKHYFKLDD